MNQLLELVVDEHLVKRSIIVASISIHDSFPVVSTDKMAQGLLIT